MRPPKSERGNLGEQSRYWVLRRNVFFSAIEEENRLVAERIYTRAVAAWMVVVIKNQTRDRR